MQTATSALVLGDLVAQEDLGLTLLSGGAGALDREIAGAHSIDVEAPTRFLERRWLMLTAGMRLKGSVQAQRALIKELDEAGISALGIGVEVVFKRVPPALLAEARERSFPVLAVPMSTAFRDIIGFINRSLLSSDLHTYQRLTAIQRHLVDALRETEPRAAMVHRLARMLDAGVLLLDGQGECEAASGPTPAPQPLSRRLAEREFELDGWHVVAVPIGPVGWLAITTRGRRTTRLARPAAQAAVPLLAATERLSELARDQERALRAALLDEILDGGGDSRSLHARAARFGVELPARIVIGTDHGELSTERRGRRVALVHGEPPSGTHAGRLIADLADAPRSLRDAELAAKAGRPAYEDFDLPTLLLAEVAPEAIQPKVDQLLDPLGVPLLEALTEYFARDMDVNAAAEAMHIHPNTLRYRLGRIEKLLDRSLRSPATIAELQLALLTRTY